MPLPQKYVLPVFLLVLVAGAMVLGPLIYFGAADIYPVPFHRAMNRGLMISALAAMCLALPRIPFRTLWPWKAEAARQLLLGYVLAFVSGQAMIGLYLAFCGFTSAGLTWAQIGARVGVAGLAALLIPPLEETLFRGFLQGELVRSLGQQAGWLLTALIFMLAHFLKMPTNLDSQPVHLWSGVGGLGASFGGIMSGAFLCGKGLNLFLIGLILGGIVLRTGSLWVNAGLHSGWVFLILLFTGTTRQVLPPRVPWLGGDLISSFITSMVLVVLGLWLWRFYRHPSDVPGSGENEP